MLKFLNYALSYKEERVIVREDKVESISLNEDYCANGLNKGTEDCDKNYFPMDGFLKKCSKENCDCWEPLITKLWIENQIRDKVEGDVKLQYLELEDNNELYENTITNFDSSQLYVTFNTTIVNSWIKRHPEKELQFTRKIRYPIYLKAIQGETIKFVHIAFNYSSDVLNATKGIFCLIIK